MPTKPLLELLNELEHVGELGRLLSIFVDQGLPTCGRRELIELTNQTAGATHRYPRPKEAIEAALRLGLLSKHGHLLQPTPIGFRFLEHRSSGIAALSLNQGKLLAGLFFDDSFLRQQVQALLETLRATSTGRLQFQSSDIINNKELSNTAILLQQLGCLQFEDGTFILNADFQDALSEDTRRVVALSEEALRKRLDQQRQRARQIEELIVLEEKKRLSQAGRPDLAEVVARISDVDVARGYDIDSYEANGTPRSIEVKSSTGRQVRFEWSYVERRKAEKMGPRYWIYFVPMAHLLPQNYCPAVMICDPCSRIRSGELIATESSALVTPPPGTPVERRFQFSNSAPLAEWKRNTP